jgi:hypothetical protein
MHRLQVRYRVTCSIAMQRFYLQKKMSEQERKSFIVWRVTSSIQYRTRTSQNKALAIMLDQKIQESKFSPEYHTALDSIKDLENKVEEAKLFKIDPHFFINKVIGELKNETDILRDEFKLAIEKKADEIIKVLEEYEQECKSNLDSRDMAKKL